MATQSPHRHSKSCCGHPQGLGLDRLIQKRFAVLDTVSDSKIEWYFDHCIATIFPSLHEGWGLPIAESLALGNLCLAADATSIPEISALTLLFDPLDPVRLAELVIQTTTIRSRNSKTLPSRF